MQSHLQAAVFCLSYILTYIAFSFIMQYYYEIELQLTKRYTCVARYRFINQYNFYTISNVFNKIVLKKSLLMTMIVAIK